MAGMSIAAPSHVRIAVHPVLWIMLAVMVGFELMFAAVDAGLLPAALGRWSAYHYLAFHDVYFSKFGLVRVLQVAPSHIVFVRAGPEMLWTPLTYAFLHAGWLHLAVNGAAFLGLGHALVQAIGVRRFLVIFVVTAIAGALAFALLSDSPYPMVGASGALFGMLAVVTAWQERMMRHAGLSRAPIWRRIGGLVLLNVLLAVGLSGMVAWQTHLGGWIAGWLLAGVIRPQRSVALGL